VGQRWDKRFKTRRFAMFCPECGKEVKEGSVFCPECGARVQQVKNSTSPSQIIGSFDKQTLLAMIGGGLLLVSFFMPWIDAGFISVSGFQLLKTASGKEKLLAIIAWLVPIGGGITAYFAYTKNSNLTTISGISGWVALIVWIWLFFSLKSEIGSNVFKALGIGMYLMVGGIALLFLHIKSIFKS